MVRSVWHPRLLPHPRSHDGLCHHVMIIHIGELYLTLAVLILDPLTLVPFVSRRSPDHIAPQRPRHPCRVRSRRESLADSSAMPPAPALITSRSPSGSELMARLQVAFGARKVTDMYLRG